MPWSPCVIAVSSVQLIAEIQAPTVSSGLAARQDEPPTQVDGVTVVAQRGAARETPDRVYDPNAIDNLGAADVGEVIGKVAQASGSHGPPIVIVNGRRVADPDVFLTFPADALARVEVLPGPSFAAYGGSDPARRVVNIVLEAKFLGQDALVSDARPTAGGAATDVGELKRSQIVGMDTSQADLGLTRASSLRAGERPAYLLDHPESEQTSLRPRSDRLTAGLTLTRALGRWRGSLAANVRRQDTDFSAQQDGQDAVARNALRALSVTGGLSGDLAHWSVRATGSSQLSQTTASGLSEVRSTSQTANLGLSANRPLATLSSGPVSLEVSARASRSQTTSHEASLTQRLHGRNQELGAQISAPLWRQSTPDQNTAPRSLGAFAVSLGANVRSIDGSRGDNLNAGFSWAPTALFNLSGSWTRSTDAPTNEQRFAPVLYGNSSVVFDFRTGKSVTLSPLVGGNPDLAAPRRETQSFGISVGPLTGWRIGASANYLRGRAVNEIAALPEPTIDVEKAFPTRFQRDTEGVLIGIDRRPINIDASATEVLISSLSAYIPLGSDAGDRAGGLQVFLGHTLRLSDQKRLKPQLSTLDRLAGDGGGAARQEVNLRLEGRRGPWAVNVAGSWQSDHTIRRDAGQDGPGDLLVRPPVILSLKLGYSLQRLSTPVASEPSRTKRRGGGLTMSVETINLFDARPRARLGDGGPAPGYGRDDRDPVGRLVRVEVTNRF